MPDCLDPLDGDVDSHGYAGEALDEGAEATAGAALLTIPQLYRTEQERWGKSSASFTFRPGPGVRVAAAREVCERMERGELATLSCVNCVTTFSLGVEALDLRMLCRRLPHTELDHRRFSAAMVRTESPSSTILLFESGNGVCTGPKTPTDSLLVVHQTIHLMRLRGFDVRVCNFQTQNIVSKVDFGHDIDLEAMARETGICAHYEPHMFPGLVFRPRPMTSSSKRARVARTGANPGGRGTPVPARDRQVDTSIVVNVFHTGKAIFTGGHCADEILQVYGWFHDTVGIASFFTAGKTTSAQYTLACRSKTTATATLQAFLDGVRQGDGEDPGAEDPQRETGATDSVLWNDRAPEMGINDSISSSVYKSTPSTTPSRCTADWLAIWRAEHPDS